MAEYLPLRVLDLNADLGEGFGIWKLTDDETLLSIVTSANVACGFHAGDPRTMRRVCDIAAQQSVRVGAQVSYRDLAGFGRREMSVPLEDLENEILYQLGALDGFCRVAGTQLSYVKPHGALNNRIYWDREQAVAVIQATLAFNPDLPLLVLPGSVVEHEARAAGLSTVAEAYLDRNYMPDGNLVSRRQPNALITGAAAIESRLDELVTTGAATTIDGQTIAIWPRSVCVHGDSPGAVESATRIRTRLATLGVAAQAFA